MEAVADTLELLRRAAVVAARLETALSSTDLTVDRWRALAHIEANPGCSMSDVIDALVVPSTSATRIVDFLVDIGAVFRTSVPARSSQDDVATVLRMAKGSSVTSNRRSREICSSLVTETSLP